MTFAWKPIKEYSDIRFELFEGIAKITINRPEVRNAFSPVTVAQMGEAFAICREREDISVVVLTGEGDKAFCSGGDMHFKGRGGYVGPDGVPRLNVLDVQKQIRSLPKPVIAMVNGYAIGGGNVLATVCDLTIASENAIFGQTGPKVGSFDAGLANTVVPFDKLEETTVEWAKQMQQYSPLALRFLKFGLNAELDGELGLQQFAGDMTMLYYMTDEAQEGGKAFLEKRKPDFSKSPRLP